MAILPHSDPAMQDHQVVDVTHYRKQGASIVLTVPKAIRDALTWQEGQLVIVTAFRDTVLLRTVTREMIDRAKTQIESETSVQ